MGGGPRRSLKREISGCCQVSGGGHFMFTQISEVARNLRKRPSRELPCELVSQAFCVEVNRVTGWLKPAGGEGSQEGENR